MFFTHLLIALIIALLLTVLFMVGLRMKSPWGVLWFFVLILLASWAGGAWFTLRGPAFLGAGWLPFLIVGLLVALLVFATITPEPEESTVELVDPKEKSAERKAAKRVLGIFFWILLLLLAGIIVVRYIRY